MRNNPKIAVLFATLLSGAASLVYQITWHRSLANLLGTEARASALILAVFLLGLAAGYHLFGRSLAEQPTEQTLKKCALIEALICGWSVVFLISTQILMNALRILPSSGPLRDIIDLVIVVGLIAPPTVLMGGTLPLLSHALARTSTSPGVAHGQIYAVNTFGAFVGALVAGLLLLPLIGIVGSLAVATSTGIVATLLLYRAASAELVVKPSQPIFDRQRDIPWRYLIVALLSGFSIITFETILIRVVGLVIGASEYAFPIVVGPFVLMIAIGSWIFATHARHIRLGTALLISLIGLVGIYLTVPQWSYLFHLLQVRQGNGEFYMLLFNIVLIVCAVAAIPVAAGGAVMPLLIRTLDASATGVGRAVGRLYFFNALGAVCGALAGGYWLYYWFDIDRVFLFTLISSGGALLLATRISGGYSSLFRGGVAVAILLTLTLPNWPTERLALGIYRLRDRTPSTDLGAEQFFNRELSDLSILEYRDDPDGTVAVVEFYDDPSRPSKALLVGGKSDGDTSGDRLTMNLLGHLPALLRGDDQTNVAVIGYGTGMTVGALTQYSDINRIDCFEISESVKRFAPHFDFANNAASENSKLNWIIGDAYRTFLHSKERYGAIISQPSDPWMAGIYRLYSVDFYRMALQNLAPQGIFLQWFGVHALSRDTTASILSSFGSVFPETRYFQIGNDIVMLGSNNEIGASALGRAEARMREVPISTALTDLGIPTLDALLGFELWVPRATVASARTNTLNNPRLAFDAGRDFFQGKFTNGDMLANSPQSQVEVLADSRTSLLANLDLLRNGETNLVQVAQTACGGASIRLVEPAWRYQRTPCREAAVALIARGKAAIPANLYREVAWLEDFTGANDQGVTAWQERDLDDARESITFFAELDSIFIPLSEKRLLWRVAHCYRDNSEENLACRAQLIRALAYTGYTRIAQSELTALGEVTPDRAQWAKLEEFVSQSQLNDRG